MNTNQKFQQGNFNKLAQTGPGSGVKKSKMLTGCGSDITVPRVVKGRTRRKFLTQKSMLSVINVETEKQKLNDIESQKRIEAYWNTYHCQSKVFTTNGKMYGYYCKNRFCTLCCSIRKASIINKYLPELQKWPEPYFVTLTVKSVKAAMLNKVMKKMIEGISRITTKYRKRNLRNSGIKLIGIRSLECNFNEITKKYNPHFHLIVYNKEVADILKMEWLKLWTRKWTYHGAQNISKVFNNTTALIEVVKYGSKIFTDPELRKKQQSKGNTKIYAAALNVIFTSMKGIRIFDRFGFNVSTCTNYVSPGAFVVHDFKEWDFDIMLFNWVDNNGNKLIDYQPEAKLLDILENKIDLKLE